jgi:hypothetical protein
VSASALDPMTAERTRSDLSSVAGEAHAPPMGMVRSALTLGVALGLVAGTAGCEPRSSLTPGNQQVRVMATATSVKVTPSTVHPGQVDFILELPNGQGVVFVRSATAAGGALTDADLTRLAQNVDAEGLSSEVMDVSCCGNVRHETLVAGKYAFVVLNPRGQAGLPPAALAVVDVQD